MTTLLFLSGGLLLFVLLILSFARPSRRFLPYEPPYYPAPQQVFIEAQHRSHLSDLLTTMLFVLVLWAVLAHTGSGHQPKGSENGAQVQYDSLVLLKSQP